MDHGVLMGRLEKHVVMLLCIGSFLIYQQGPPLQQRPLPQWSSAWWGLSRFCPGPPSTHHLVTFGANQSLAQYQYQYAGDTALQVPFKNVSHRVLFSRNKKSRFHQWQQPQQGPGVVFDSNPKSWFCHLRNLTEVTFSSPLLTYKRLFMLSSLPDWTITKLFIPASVTETTLRPISSTELAQREETTSLPYTGYLQVLELIWRFYCLLWMFSMVRLQLLSFICSLSWGRRQGLCCWAPKTRFYCLTFSYLI